MPSQRKSWMLAAAIGVQLGRFLVIVAGSQLFPVLGVPSWDVGLLVNALCCVYAVILVGGIRG